MSAGGNFIMGSKKDYENIKDIKAYMGEDAVFKGSLTFAGAVRVDGTLEGEVKTEDTLIVGEKGVLEANITAGTVICKGKIKGSINAATRVEIYSNSEVIGDVNTPSLFVEVGAVLDGQCNMVPKEKKIINLMKDESGDSEKEALG